MKIFFNLVSIFILITVLLFVSINSETSFNFAVWSAGGQTTWLHNVSMLQIMMFTFLAGVISGIFWVSTFNFVPHKKLKEYKQKLDKTLVQSEEESSKVAVLEEKIKVLEKALESALNKDSE